MITRNVRHVLPWLTGLLLMMVTGSVAAAESAPQAITPQTRCAVCGMMPAHYPKWQSQLIFKDQAMVAFDSPADLFVFLIDMGRYDKHHTSADVASIYVTHYAKGGWLLAKQAWFVSGSAIDGPMGPDLPAFAAKAEAEKFAAEHGGKALKYEAVTREVIAPLRQLSVAPPHQGATHMHH